MATTPDRGRPVRREIRFILGAEEVRLGAVGAGDTLLDWLRLERRLTGTKEGCAEGDCGACTVLVGRLVPGEGGAPALVYETVNACIRLLASLDACHVVTIEHVTPEEGGLHPVQEAMVIHHASQCGFCTPGIVMSLHALWSVRPDPTRPEIEAALQGNLCRCTGYGPILAAAGAAGRIGRPEDDPLMRGRAAMALRLAALRDGARVEVARSDPPGGGGRAILPADVDDLAAILLAEPEATIVAGATDVGLWVTKGMRAIAPAVHVGHLDGLRGITAEAGGLRLGAGTSYAEAEGAMIAAFPHLDAYWRRIGGSQVRNMGTIGGNIANGSPIGDMPPVLIALGARLVLRRGERRREIALESFFIDYGRQDRAPGEFVEALHIPAIPEPGPGRWHHRAYKVSKRRDEDISAVAAGLSIRVEGGGVAAARLAFGGMAATPRRAVAAEAALIGRPWDGAAAERAAAALATDFTPISDWRASAAYRALVAGNLIRRLAGETCATEPQEAAAGPERA